MVAVDTLDQILKPWWSGEGQLTILTGAGISAASGIPTFRGPEGYWQQGSTVYQPQQLATAEMFFHDPLTVWSWYLYRHALCQSAQANPAHHLIHALEQHAPERFTLITQNVDGLHLRAGNSHDNTLQIHGQIDRRRCAQSCCQTLFTIPDKLQRWAQHQQLDRDTLQQYLQCPQCGGLSRPHILWIDECYDEVFYRMNSALRRTEQADILLIIGTTGATTLPQLLVEQALRRGTRLVEINPESSSFTGAIEASGGDYLQASAVDGLAPLQSLCNNPRP